MLRADPKSNLFNHQYTSLVTLAEACKEDLVVVDARTASRLGSLPRLLLVRSVNAVVRLVDPQTGRIAELHTEGYFKAPPSVCFGVLCSSHRRLAGHAVGTSPPTRRRERASMASPAPGATRTPSPRLTTNHTGRPVRVAARAFCGVGCRARRKRQGSTTAGDEGVFQKTKKAGGPYWSKSHERLSSRRHFGEGARFRRQRRPDHVQDAPRCFIKMRRPRLGL